MEIRRHRAHRTAPAASTTTRRTCSLLPLLRDGPSPRTKTLNWNSRLGWSPQGRRRSDYSTCQLARDNRLHCRHMWQSVPSCCHTPLQRAGAVGKAESQVAVAAALRMHRLHRTAPAAQPAIQHKYSLLPLLRAGPSPRKQLPCRNNRQALCLPRPHNYCHNKQPKTGIGSHNPHLTGLLRVSCYTKPMRWRQ